MRAPRPWPELPARTSERPAMPTKPPSGPPPPPPPPADYHRDGSRPLPPRAGMTAGEYASLELDGSVEGLCVGLLFFVGAAGAVGWMEGIWPAALAWLRVLL